MSTAAGAAVTARRRLRLAHTSDVHLGCDYRPLSAGVAALHAVVDAARRQHADALLVAGDLIDHNRVPDDVVALAAEGLARFGGPVFVLPGNHDAYDGRSVYRRPVWTAASPDLWLLVDPELDVEIPTLGLAVWGRPVIEHSRAFRPLGDVPRRRTAGWRVVMAHGHLELPGDEPRSSPIVPEEIAAADADYVALGHWDRHADVSSGGVAARYSGAPYDDGDGTRVVVVDLDPAAGVRAERVDITPEAAVS